MFTAAGMAVVLAALAMPSCAADTGDTIPTSVVDVITEAGGTCGPVTDRGEQDCELESVKFRLAGGESWTQDRALRRQACDEGWVNPQFLVLTDGHWTITADHHKDLDTIRDALAGQGVTADTRRYCS